MCEARVTVPGAGWGSAVTHGYHPAHSCLLPTLRKADMRTHTHIDTHAHVHGHTHPPVGTHTLFPTNNGPMISTQASSLFFFHLPINMKFSPIGNIHLPPGLPFPLATPLLGTCHCPEVSLPHAYCCRAWPGLGKTQL